MTSSDSCLAKANPVSANPFRGEATLVVAGTLVLIVAALYWARPVLMPVALAMLLTFLLSPVDSALQRLGLGRVFSVVVLAVLMFSLIGVIGWGISVQLKEFANDLPGYQGNILVIYDIRKPAQPEEVSRWWLPGQHIAGGETPTWPGRQHRLHHALRVGDRLWAGCWHGGVRIIDVSDIRKPHTIGAYNYHPPFPEPSHTFMGVPFPVAGRQIALAIDEEDHAHDGEEMARRRGRPHGCLWVFDVTDPAQIKPLSIFEVSELDSPWSRAAPGRFGAHQFHERMDGDTLVYCTWFAGGLRIVDVADPLAPQEVGHYIPEPAPGQAGPQTNDVDVDKRGIIYLVDRGPGFNILEFQRP